MENTKKRLDTRTITLCSLFAALTAIGAFIRVPLPVVPFTMQLFFTALAGVLLGAKKGALSQLIYVLVGLVGVPIFTKGGGLHYIFEPTFGYLVGFIAGAYVIGLCIEKLGATTFKNLFLSTLLGVLVIYACGVPYMYMIYNFYLKTELGVWAAIVSGAISCAPGDVLSCFITSVVGVKIMPTLRNNQLI